MAKKKLSTADRIINGTYGIDDSFLESNNQTADNIINGTFDINSYQNKIKDNSKYFSVKPTVNNTTNSNNSFSFSIDNKKEDKKEPTFGDKSLYVAKNLGGGVVQGVTGLVDAPLQYVQEGVEDEVNNKLPWYLDNKYGRQLATLGDQDMSTGGKILSVLLDNSGLGDIKDVFYNEGKQLAKQQKTAPEVIQKTREVVNTPSENIQKSLAEEKEDYSGLVQFLGGGANTIGNMGPAIAATAAGNPTAALTLMGVSAKGTATKEAENKGASLKEANTIGTIKGATEVGTEVLTGGLKIFPSGTLDDVTKNLINKSIKNEVANFVAQKAAGYAGEVGEEIISDLVGLAVDKATVDPNATYSLDDLKNTVLNTLFTTGVINAGYDITNKIATGKGPYQINKEELLKYNKTQELIDKEFNKQKTDNMSKQELKELRTEIENKVVQEVEDTLNEVFVYTPENENTNVIEETEETQENNVVKPYENTNNQIENIIEEEIETENEIESNLETENIISGLETYISQNNISDLTKEDIERYIEKALQEQENLTEQEKNDLGQKYFDTIQKYLDNKNKPKDITPTDINIPKSKQLSSGNTPNKTIRSEIRNEARNKQYKINGQVEGLQNAVNNALESQYKNFSDKSITSLKNSVDAFNLGEEGFKGDFRTRGDNTNIDVFRRSVATYFRNLPETQAETTKFSKVKTNVMARSNEYGKEIMPKFAKNKDAEYNNQRKFNSVEEAIKEDARKKPYAKYNTSVDLFNLDLNDMAKVVAEGSNPAQLAKLTGENKGIYSVEVNNKYYDAYFELLNQENDNNYYGIYKFKPIRKGVESDYDSATKTDSFIKEYIRKQKGTNNRNSESVGNKEATRRNDGIYSKELSKQKIDDNKQIARTSRENNKLEDRVSGDALLDAQDLIEEIKTVGANVDENGYVTLYHQTTNENAKKIIETGKMSGKENGIFFSTSKNASQADGRGQTKLEFKIPAEKLLLDDIFSDNADLKINSKPGEQIDVKEYLQEKNEKPLSKEKNTINENKKDEVLTLKTDNGTKVDLKSTGNNTFEKVDTKPNKNQIISKDDITNQVLNMGDKKVSNFYSNATEKSKFITEENRVKLMDNDTLQYYDAITNKDTLQNALDKLDSNAEQQVGDFFAKKEFTPEDVATGWILVKRYQDAGNFEAMSNVLEKMREQGTKAGQTIQMYNILERLTPEGMEYYSQKKLDNAFNEFSKNKSKDIIDKYAKDFTLTAEEHQFIKDTMEKVAQLEDEDAKKVEVAKVVKMLSDKLPPERGQRLKAWMRISMLGNPKTQVRNIAGNAIIQPVNWTGDIFGAIADKLISKKTGIRTKGNTNFKALAGGFAKGTKDAIRDAKLGVDTRDINLDRFEENIGGKPFYEGHNLEALNKGAKVLNKVNKVLGNIMSGGDRVFYQAVYDNSLQNQMKLNKVEKPTQEMIDIATQEALSRTWNDSNGYTKAVLQIRNAMNKLNVKGYGLGDVLIPFAKTPANLTKAIVDYSPLGLARSILQDGRNLKNSLKNGQYNAQLQHKFADSLGKGFAGSLLYVAAYALAKAGITTGDSDEDKDVSNFMRNTLGIQPYSVKIGDKSFTYDWAQPIAAPFAIMADAKKLGEKENQELTDIISTYANTGTNLLLEQSFLSSIKDVFNSYNGPADAIQNEIKELPARATPTFFKQIADMIDSTKRQTYVKGDTGEYVKNQVISKIPVASKSLESQRDTLGREIEKYGGNENELKYAFNVFLNPANTQKGKVSEAAEEIYNVYQATGDKTIMPRQVGYSENVGGTTRNLTASERNEWQKLSGEKVEESVSALLNNNKYNSMSDEDKAEVISGIVNYSFNKAKSDLFGTDISTTYKTAAKKEEQGIPVYDYYVDRVSKRK